MANIKIAQPEDLYNLVLHQTGEISNWIDVIRVPGGWIYQFNCPVDEGTDYGVFVPFENEFQKK